jgi:hypothetical protein
LPDNQVLPGRLYDNLAYPGRNLLVGDALRCGELVGARQRPTFPVARLARQTGQNADGSTDLYLGLQAPAGKAGNCLATVPGKGYFAILRLYGPTEAAMNRSWKPGDIEKVK